MSISSPIVTIIGSSPFFLAGGAAVLFTQSMGKQTKYKADQVFKTSFYMVLILAILETACLIGFNHIILVAMSSPPEQALSTDPPELQTYFQKVHDLQISFASHYTMIYSAGILLPLLIFYFASLIKSEGRFRVVVVTSIVCNCLNIGLIVIFILFGHLDMYGGALGSTVSYAVNLIILLIYMVRLNMRNETWLSFKLLFKRNLTSIKWNLISPIILVGLSAFLIDISYAVANIFYIPILANTSQLIYPNAGGNGMYFQTIEGATMPILNFVFVTIYGIVDGERAIIAYNYSLGNWSRVKKAYRYTIFISFFYSLMMVVLLSLALGKPILHLFDISNPTMFNDAYFVLLIQLIMLPAFSFQAPAMSIYMAIADTTRSNIAAIFQDIITFFPVLGICYGITMATNNI
jgi:Na+-driven multidrug efflux pump